LLCGTGTGTDGTINLPVEYRYQYRITGPIVVTKERKRAENLNTVVVLGACEIDRRYSIAGED
jgi:hypothetical protein